MRVCRCRILLVALLLIVAGAAGTVPAMATSRAPDDAVIRNFERVWVRTDSPQVRGDRTFLWGPEPIIPVIEEPLAGLPGGRHAVLYWDKGRMEVNDPAAAQDRFYVTNGRLVAELVTGRQQIGIGPEAYAQRVPAAVPFGDLNDATGPTYASFRERLGDRPLAPGQPVAQGLDRAGQPFATEAGGVVCQVVVAETNHCIAAPFWAFLNQSGPVYDGGAVVTGALFDPMFGATGLPISEPYWITVRSGDQPTRILIQLFERRTLTFNPANAAATRVEMGNVGLHYYHWRYDAQRPGDAPAGLDPAMRAASDQVYGAGPGYQYLIDNLAGGRFQLLFQDLGDVGAYGAASGEYRVVILDNALASQDPRNPAAVLAHEAQHAYDFSTAGDPRSAAECYAFELRGFLVGSALWQTFY
ncbi:MAG: hypothetical protein AVDCRST_MAG88-4141, partial [uncultured Thermomicrobiales bacterium]